MFVCTLHCLHTEPLQAPLALMAHLSRMLLLLNRELLPQAANICMDGISERR